MMSNSLIRKFLPRTIKDQVLVRFHPLTSIAIELTNNCNEDCSYCHRKLRPQGDMTLPLYNKLIKQIPKGTLLALSYGGESIVHSDFTQMVKIARAQGFNPIAFSNGLEPYPPDIEVIKYPKPPPIIFTHDQRFEDRELLKTLRPANTFCRDLYRYMAVLWDGVVVPCCHCVAGNRVMGNAETHTLKAIWESAAYTKLRGVGHCKDCELWRYNLGVDRP